MAVLPVVRYPDPRLKRGAEPVGVVTPETRRVAADLVETMHASPATVGLAAPQVGWPARVFALDVSGHRRATSSHGLLVLVDPDLVEAQGSETIREGCLSVPDLTANVRRPLRIVLSAVDLEGERRVYEMEGFEARAALHELDHLEGTLILDRVAAASELFARRVYG